MTDDFLTVTTFLWSDIHRKRSYTFTPEHVVILRNMVKRHLHVPHEFVCVSDYVGPAIDGIRFVPLDMSRHVPGTVFARLMLRHPRIGGILGKRILNLDLDCVIVDDITPLVAHLHTRAGTYPVNDAGEMDVPLDWVSRTEPSVFWRNPNYEEGGRRAFYQTSIQLLDAGSHSELWRDFDPQLTPTWVNRRFGGAEQAWVSERLPWDLPHWTDRDGIYGAGRMFRDQGGDINMDNGVQAELPDNARIIFFPGDRHPDMPEVRKQFPFIEEFYR